MTENMTPDTLWYLKEMIAKSDRDFAEGNVLTHDQVKEKLKMHRNENRVVPACV